MCIRWSKILFPKLLRFSFLCDLHACHLAQNSSYFECFLWRLFYFYQFSTLTNGNYSFISSTWLSVLSKYISSLFICSELLFFAGIKIFLFMCSEILFLAGIKISLFIYREIVFSAGIKISRFICSEILFYSGIKISLFVVHFCSLLVLKSLSDSY